MHVKVRFVFEGRGTVIGVLEPVRSPSTFEMIVGSLPFESTARRWGDEVYFETPVEVEEENAVEVVDVGVIAYWPPGKALCLFFGPTPASRSPGEVRAYSPVNVLGRVAEGIEVLRRVEGGERVRVERAG